MLVTAIGSLAPEANIPSVLGVATQKQEVVSTLAQIDATREQVSEALENAKTRRAETKAKLELRRQEISQKIEERKEALRERLAQVQDARKRTVVQNIAESLNTKNQRWVSHWTNVIDRLTQILAKVEDRTTRAKESGVDTTTVEAAITSAKNSIADAQSAVSNQAAKVYEINIGDEESLRADVKEAIDQFKTDTRTVHSSIKIARESVVAALRALAAVLPGEREE